MAPQRERELKAAPAPADHVAGIQGHGMTSPSRLPGATQTKQRNGRLVKRKDPSVSPGGAGAGATVAALQGTRRQSRARDQRGEPGPSTRYPGEVGLGSIKAKIKYKRSPPPVWRHEVPAAGGRAGRRGAAVRAGPGRAAPAASTKPGGAPMPPAGPG